MTSIATDTATLALPAEQLFTFLADLSNHRAFLEPAAMDFSGDADSHRYKVEIIGMTVPVESTIGERVSPTLVTLVPGAKKLFDHTLASRSRQAAMAVACGSWTKPTCPR